MVDRGAVRQLDNLERIRTPDPETFRREYIARGRPVVLVDFLQPKTIARLRTLADPRAARMFDEAALLELLGPHARTTMLPASAELRHDVAGLLGGMDHDDAESELWGGRAGGETVFHYDLDMRANLLAQVFGRKRVSLASPDATQKLEPLLHGSRPQFSSRNVAAYSPDERHRFLDYIGALDTVLGPGEAVFIPALWWHHLEYVDTTLSITMRLGRTPIIRALAAMNETLWPSEVELLQGIAAVVATDTAAARDAMPRVDELCTLHATARRGGRAANNRFVAALRALHASLCPGRLVAPLCERDEPMFATHARRRPEVSRVGTNTRWTADSIPWLAPGFEIAEVVGARDAATFRVVSEAGSVVAHVTAPEGADDAMREVLRGIARRGGASIREHATEAGVDVDTLAGLVERWAMRDWIVGGKRKPRILIAAYCEPQKRNLNWQLHALWQSYLDLEDAEHVELLVTIPPGTRHLIDPRIPVRERAAIDHTFWHPELARWGMKGGYGYVNSCLAVQGLRPRWDYILRTDCDTILTDRFPAFTPDKFLVSRGMFNAQQLDQMRAFMVRKKLPAPPSLLPVGSTWLGPADRVIACNAKQLSLCRTLFRDEDWSGGPPERVLVTDVLMYAGIVAVNAFGGPLEETTLLDGFASPVVDDTSIHVHMWSQHDPLKGFSKQWFELGLYDTDAAASAASAAWAGNAAELLARSRRAWQASARFMRYRRKRGVELALKGTMLRVRRGPRDGADIEIDRSAVELCRWVVAQKELVEADLFERAGDRGSYWAHELVDTLVGAGALVPA